MVHSAIDVSKHTNLRWVLFNQFTNSKLFITRVLFLIQCLHNCQFVTEVQQGTITLSEVGIHSFNCLKWPCRQKSEWIKIIFVTKSDRKTNTWMKLMNKEYKWEYLHVDVYQCVSLSNGQYLWQIKWQTENCLIFILIRNFSKHIEHFDIAPD